MADLPLDDTQHLSIAPDESELAVLRRQDQAVEIYSLPQVRLVATIPVTVEMISPWDDQVVHLGGAVVHLEMVGDGPRRWELVRHRREDLQREVLHEFVGEHQVLLAPTGDGFLVSTGHTFLFGAADGPVREQFFDGREAMLLDTHPASDRIAVVMFEPGSFCTRQQEILLLDAGLDVLGRAAIGSEGEHIYNRGGWFCGPDRLVTLGQWNHLKSWRRQDGDLVLNSSRHLDKYKLQFAMHGYLGKTVVPRLGLMAVEYESSTDWFDIRTMRPVVPPAAFGDTTPLWLSLRYVVHWDYGLKITDLSDAPAFAPGAMRADDA